MKTEEGDNVPPSKRQRPDEGEGIKAEERWSGQPTDGSHENAGKSGAQQQGQGGSGMQALPRPPPLTIPFDGSLPIGQSHLGISPLPVFLNSPYLEGMMLTSSSPNLMAMYNQMALTSRVGSGMTGLTPGINNGIEGAFTPGSYLWPETTRSVGGSGAFKPPGELAAAAAANASASGSAISSQQHQAVGGSAGSGRVGTGGESTSGSQLQALAPLVSPATIAAAAAGSTPYRGIQFDKERGKWQVVLWDGIRQNVVGEYPNEMEALVASELMSPALPPTGSLQAGGMNAFMTSDPRGPSIQEVLARASTSAMVHQASQGSLISPLGGGAALSPLGALSPMGLAALLGGVPTPRDMSGGGMLGHQQPKNYRGVRYHKERHQWQAYILDDDQVHWLGFYGDEEEAARAHDAEALRRFGPSADVNFGTDSPTEMLQAYPTSYGGFGSSLLSTLPHAPLNMWSGMGGEAQQQPLMYPQQDYQQQVGRRGSGRGRGGRTPGRGRGRGRGGGGGSRSRGAAAYGDGSSDFSLDGSEADEEAMTEDEDDEWTGLKAKSVSKRGRARKPSAMAAAVAATVAEEATAFGDFPNIGHQNSVSFRNQAASGRQSQGGGGGGTAGAPSTSFSFPAGVPLVARVVSKFRGVTWDDESSKWLATAYEGSNQVHLGLFDNQEDAARAYDMAISRSGKKERLNFPPTHVRDPSAMTKSRSASGHKITSQYKGVSWNSACSKWVAVLWDRELKRARHIGSFESEEDAARAYDREAIKMLGPDAGLNFRESLEEYMLANGSFTGGSGGGAAGNAASAGGADKGSSQYRGVSWHERSQRWEVRVWGGGKQHFIGSFTSEVEAARAYDKAVLRLRGQDARSRSRMNFPVSEYNLDEINAEPLGNLEALLGQDLDFGGGGGGGGGGGSAVKKRGGGRKAKRRDDDLDYGSIGGSGGDFGDFDLGMGMGGAGPSRMLQQHQSQQQQQMWQQQNFQLFQKAPSPGMGSAQATPAPTAPAAPMPAPATGSSAMALAAALGATGNNTNVAAAAIASLPAVSIYFDEAKRKWASALVVAGNATVLGYSDNESSARSMAHSSLVAALSPVMGSSAAAAMATAAMNKSPSGASKRVSMDLGGPSGTGNTATASTSSLNPEGSSAAAAGALTTAPTGDAGGSSGALWGGDASGSSVDRQPGIEIGDGGVNDEDFGFEEGGSEGEELDDDSSGGGRRGARGAMAGGGTAPSTVVPGGKPTMRGKSQYRGVSWCEKVKKWRALLWNGQKQLFLGHFSSDMDAARAYDRALIELKGSEAKTNFPTADYEGGSGVLDLAAVPS